MSGGYTGVQTSMRMLQPLAIYTHRCSHVLNFVVSAHRNLFRGLRSLCLICEVRPNGNTNIKGAKK